MIYGYIYKTTDTRNGLIYIGQHKAKRFNPFYFGSGRDICQLPYDERLKYYKVELLHVVNDTGNEEHDSLELDRLEIQEIAKHHSTDPKIGYNRNMGGQHHAGWYRSAKGRYIMHKGSKTVRVHPEYVQMYLDDGYEYGMSDNIKSKIRERTIEVTRTEEYRQKQHRLQKGKKRTAESKQRSSDAAKKRWQDKEKCANMYGRITINNGNIHKHVFKEEAERLVNTGEWRYGAIRGKRHLDSKYPIYNPTTQIVKRVPIEKIDEYLATGEWQRGQRPCSKEHCDKIAKMRTGRKWMNKNGQLIQAKPEDVDELLQHGWRLGKK